MEKSYAVLSGGLVRVQQSRKSHINETFPVGLMRRSCATKTFWKIARPCATKTCIRHFTREKSCAGLMRTVGLLHKVLCVSYAVFGLIVFLLKTIIYKTTNLII